jgi:DNA-binding transcriptional LysR family regulator
MNKISTNQIEIFLAAARSKSISAVARKLYLSQPAISTAILQMESELGCKLLERTNHGVALTTAGRRLYARLDPVYKHFSAESQMIFEETADGGQKNLDLRAAAFWDSDMIRYMSAANSLFLERYPAKNVGAECFLHNTLRTKLLCEELDFIFTSSSEVAGRPEFECIRLRNLDMFFIVPAGWRATCSGDFGFLLGKTLLLEPSAEKETLLSVCHAHGLFPKSVKHILSPLLLMQMVADGEGFSVGGRHIPNADALAPHIRCIPVRASDCNQYIHLVAAWRYDDDRNDTKRYIEILADRARLDAAAERAAPDAVTAGYY